MSKSTEHAKKPNFTKAGPGRYHRQGDGTRKHLTLKQRRAGMYGKALRNHFDRKQAQFFADRAQRRMDRQTA